MDWISIYFGGQYYLPGDPKFKANVPWTNKKVRQAMNMAVNRQELLETMFAGKATPVYVSGWLPISEGWNPEWVTRFDQLYGYNPAKAKELLKEAGYARGTVKVKIVAFTNPGESEGPQVAEALGVYFQEVGIDATIETLDRGEGTRHGSKQVHALLHLAQYHRLEALGRTDPRRHYQSRLWGSQLSRTSSSISTIMALTQSVDPRRKATLRPGRLATISSKNSPTSRSSGSTMRWPSNPKVVADWTYPGLGGGRSTHFHLLKAAK